MTSVSTEGEGVPDRKGAFRTRVLHFEPRVVCFPLCEHLKLQRLGQKLQYQTSSSFFRKRRKGGKAWE